MVTLSINDRKVQVPSGASVLDAANAAGERVPTLCHIKELFPSGACRMCVVEVKGRPASCPRAPAPPRRAWRSTRAARAWSTRAAPSSSCCSRATPSTASPA